MRTLMALLNVFCTRDTIKSCNGNRKVTELRAADFTLRRSGQVSDVLISLHWLRVPERIRSKVAVLVYKVLLGPFSYDADLPSRRGLRSSCRDCLVQPPVHRSTVDSRAFSVAGRQVWNCVAPEIMSAPSLTTFRTRFETFLFTESYRDIRLI